MVQLCIDSGSDRVPQGELSPYTEKLMYATDIDDLGRRGGKHDVLCSAV